MKKTYKYSEEGDNREKRKDEKYNNPFDIFGFINITSLIDNISNSEEDGIDDFSEDEINDTWRDIKK